MNRDQLLEILEKHNVPAVTFESAEGGVAICTQRGARVLGVFPCGKGGSPNAVWVNPHIEAVLNGTASDWEGQGEGGMGGDRVWVSPERNYYYSEPKTFGGWFCQLDMDPGKYETTAGQAGSVTYRNRFSLKDVLNGTLLENVTLERRISPAANPLADAALKAKLAYVGLDSVETLELPGAGAAPSLCPWTLIQVPVAVNDAAATVIVPTARTAAPIGYFGELPHDRYVIFCDHVLYKIDSKLVTKLAIRAEDLPSEGPIRVAYVRAANGNAECHGARDEASWQLLVLESESVARDSKDAIDPAKADPDGARGVVQSYNNGAPGQAMFGEIELQHLPVKAEGGLFKSVAHCRMYSFQGGKEDILAAAGALLNLGRVDVL